MAYNAKSGANLKACKVAINAYFLNNSKLYMYNTILKYT